MPQTARHLEASDDADWITATEASALIGISPRHCRRLAESKSAEGQARRAPPPSGPGKDVWWLHRTIDPALRRNPNRATRAERERDALLAEHAEHKVHRAYRRFHWLTRWRTLCTGDPRPARTIAADVVAEAKKLDGEDFPISPRSLESWHAAHNAIGPDGQIAGIAALVPKHNGPIGARSASDGAPSEISNLKSQITRSPEAIAYFYTLYRTEGDHTAKTCHAATREAAQVHGWSWPDSYSATTQWLQKHDDLATTCLHRDPRRYRHNFMPSLDRDWSLVPPAGIYILDHAQLDLWCDHDGEQIRPWLSAIIDGRSRCLVGWHIGPSPHSDAILASMRVAFSKWAIPAKICIDNGKDYTSQVITGATKKERIQYKRELGADWQQVLRHNDQVFFTGVAGELGIDVTYAIPESPWSKALIERAFGRVHDEFDRTFATYCGRDTLRRPECLQVIRRGYTASARRALQQKHGKKDWEKHAVLKLVNTADVPTMDQVRSEFADWLTVYHNAAHTGDGMQGQAPLQVWRTATSLRQADAGALLHLCQARGVYRVGRNGVSFVIGGARMVYGGGSAKLHGFVGRDVFVTVDPADAGFCNAFTAEGASRVFVARLEANDRLPADTPVDQLREAMREIQSRRKTMRRAASQAPQRMRSAAQELRARRAKQAAELRRTGTDDAGFAPSIIPVQTGFEGVSTPAVPQAEGDREGSRKLPALCTPGAPDNDLHDLCLDDLVFADAPIDVEEDAELSAADLSRDDVDLDDVDLDDVGPEDL